MRVYYYTAQEYALSNIINERLKISLFDELNDPFELLGVELSDKEFQTAFKAGRDAVAKKFGIISFSKDWNNPLLWAHYGDKHKGICLGFDVDDSLIKEVLYFPEKIVAKVDMEIKLGGLTEDIVANLMRTKYIKWEYENEVRVFVPIETKDLSGFYFTDFEGTFELKEVILGPRCHLEIENVAKYLCSYKSEVKILHSRVALTDKYEVVQNEDVPIFIHRA